MSQIAEQKCPACGAPLRFDPASGKLVCDYCGTVTEVQSKPEKPMKKPSQGSPQGQAPAGHAQGTAEQAASAGHTQGTAEQTASAGHAQGTAEQAASVEAPAPSQKPQSAAKAEDSGGPGPSDTVEGFDFSSITDMVTDPAAMDLPVYNCVSCGAEVIAPPEQIALTCPYCGNNIVLTQKVTGKLRPDGIIPFKISSGDLPDAVNRFYKDKKLLPRGFFSKSTMGKVTGVYVPFWVFSGNISGRIEYDAQTSSSARRGDYIITTTNHYRLVRDAALDFENLPVDASGRIDDRLMDSLEPFDPGQTQPFDMRYLAGFTADRFDQKKEDISARAKKRMLSTTSSVVRTRACKGYSAATQRSSNLNTRMDAKYILFPVYMFDISFAGKNYHFAVNGQTGKVVGDLPTDQSVSTLYFLKRFGIISGGLILLSVAKYMLGM